MAGVSPPLTAEALLSKRVQEMVLTGEEPSGPFICRNTEDEEDDDSTQNSPIPIIQLAKLSAKESKQELDKLKSALSTWGCFQVFKS